MRPEDFGKDFTGDELEKLAVNTIRALSMDAVEKAKSGHPGMPMGAASLAYVLWMRFLRHSPAEPRWPDRDRFVLSAGHGSMLLYSLLHLFGYPLPIEELMQFRQWGSHTPGHPEHNPELGIETTTGPLGQGFANGVGMAIAEALLRELLAGDGFPPVDHFTYAIVSDGDLMEGVASEAASLAGHLGLGKLIYLYDDNRITIEGSTELAFSENVAGRFDAYGWHTQEIDGHDRRAIAAAISRAQAETARPSLIVARTHIARGSPGKQGKAEAHGAPLGEEEVKAAKINLGFPVEPPFLVPDVVKKLFSRRREELEHAREDWQKQFSDWRVRNRDKARLWDSLADGELPSDLDAKFPKFEPGQSIATRSASGQILQALAAKLPGLVGGSADLAPSTNTYLKGMGSISRNNFRARNLHFGVREHAMGGILNGMALHGGLRVYGGTFLIFSDYMRPSIRLAAVMKLPVVYVFTHDSIFLGEDGPTHQPVEHLAALRAIPGLTVIRPADAHETAVAWMVALRNREGPTALILSRQNLPVLDRTGLASAEGLARGAYTLLGKDAEQPDILLIASGSEVHIALEAAKLISEKGKLVHVVSMPSWELFERQPEKYRNEVLPGNVAARLAIEAARSLGWERYVGQAGRVIAMDRFGASAPNKVLAEKFGFTAANVAEHASRLIDSTS